MVHVLHRDFRQVRHEDAHSGMRVDLQLAEFFLRRRAACICGRQEVVQAVVVDLDEGGLQPDLRAPGPERLELREQRRRDAREQAPLLGIAPVAMQGVGLAGTGLTVGTQAAIVALQCSINQLFADVVVHRLLVGVARQFGVAGIQGEIAIEDAGLLVLLRVAQHHPTRRFDGNGKAKLLVLGQLVRQSRPQPYDCDDTLAQLRTHRNACDTVCPPFSRTQARIDPGAPP
mmetsp:Transcript_71213/g.231356  ORF Transcript_71213/g.231356 Transcript_71213/m.231356 type:complete len:230 (-) Transcript_71213:170-859(-)